MWIFEALLGRKKIKFYSADQAIYEKFKENKLIFITTVKYTEQYNSVKKFH